MPEGLLLTSSDLANVVANLKAENFNGYLTWQLAPQQSAYVFFCNGEILSSFRYSGQEDFKVWKADKLVERAGSQGTPAHSYVLSPRMAKILSYSFGFRPIYQQHTLPPKSLKKVVDEVESEKLTGIAAFESQGQTSVVAWERGEILNETFVTGYGQFLCGRDQVTQCFNRANAEGATLSVFAEKTEIVEKQMRRFQRDLDRLTPLTPKSVSGFFASKDTLKLDADIVKKWGVSGAFQLLVEDEDGRLLGAFKAQGANGKDNQIEVPLKILQSWGIESSSQVEVYPQAD